MGSRRLIFLRILQLVHLYTLLVKFEGQGSRSEFTIQEENVTSNECFPVDITVCRVLLHCCNAVFEQQEMHLACEMYIDNPKVCL